jgi:hypothetical protein
VGIALLLAFAVLALHLAFIAWVVFGALWTRRRPLLRWFHIAMLAWSVVVEVGPWPCPLTVAENWLDTRAGIAPYRGGFMLHYLDRIVYPNIPPNLLTLAALLVVATNATIYVQRFRYRNVNHCW